MSGRRIKQLRKECRERLGRAPFKADGHVTHMTSLVAWRDERGRSILSRIWNYFTRPKEHVPQIDEFRFFKRHGATPQEIESRRAEKLAQGERHRLAVERNNERMEDLRRERTEVAA